MPHLKHAAVGIEGPAVARDWERLPAKKTTMIGSCQTEYRLDVLKITDEADLAEIMTSCI